jgi:hypothetical protein
MASPGETVLVPTEVGDGAFPNEKLVTVDTNEGPVSGFARADFIVQKPDGQFLLAEVKKVSERGLTVRLFGSFFTTTGIADLPVGTRVLKAAG